MSKAIKIGETLDSFLIEHPEVKIIRSSNGKIRRVCIPEDATITSLIILDNEVCDLAYIYNDEFYHFSKKETL